MCSRYEAPAPAELVAAFGTKLVEPVQAELWPGYVGPFIRRLQEGDSEDGQPGLEAKAGVFGLLPFWAKDQKLARRTYNARSETVAEKPSFRAAWREGRHCLIPASAIYEPDWRSGKAVPARICRADGEPMGIAGLWERWAGPSGEVVHSYTMLTINADQHSLMRHYHKPSDEKRMVVILPRRLYRDWLAAPAANSMEFMRQYPADRLQVAERPR